MNIGEANAWFRFLEGLETNAGERQLERARDAADELTERANKALGAGPRPVQVGLLVVGVHEALQTAADDPDYPVEVTLGGRPVTTTPAAGGRL